MQRREKKEKAEEESSPYAVLKKSNFSIGYHY